MKNQMKNINAVKQHKTQKENMKKLKSKIQKMQTALNDWYEKHARRADGSRAKLPTKKLHETFVKRSNALQKMENKLVEMENSAYAKAEKQKALKQAQADYSLARAIMI